MRPDWSGQAVACIASGPSLTKEDCETVRAAGVPVVVTNTTFRMCPWADALCANDTKWWRRYHREVAEVFHGRGFCGSPVAENFGAEWYRALSNSGACAISLAITCGASKIVLIGYDAGLGPNGETHHHGDHPSELSNAASIGSWPQQFELVARQARRRGVQVLNASRRTALTCFERVALESAW